MITKEELLKKIGELLDELKTQHESLITGDKAAKELEAELFEANASYFASHVSILNKLIGNEGGIGDTEQDGGQQTSVTDEAETEGLPEVNPEPVKETIFTPATVIPEEKSGNEDEDDAVSGQENEEEEAEQEEHAEESSRRDGEENEAASGKEEVTADDTEESSEIENEEDNDAEEEQANPNEDEVEAEEAEEAQPSTDKMKPDRDDASDIPSNSNGSSQPIVQEVQVEEKEVTIPEEQPSRPLTLNERLSAQRTQQAGSYYQSPSALQQAPQRVADLKTAISLNDKLLFIRDLFNGYSLAYSEAIELLNRFDNFADAQAFLEKNYAEKNSWVSKQQAVEKLYGILRKKFG